MTERLIIDLAACDRCETPCHDPAVLAIRERATFELVCRRCQVASCVLACPFQALERTADGIIKRHNLRCVSCKSCALACPFGTIYAELLPFYSMDYAAAVEQVRASLLANGGREQARSYKGCDALFFGAMDADDPDLHVIDEHLAARVQRWVRKEVAA